MREVDFAQDLQRGAAAHRGGRGGPFAHAIHGEDSGVFEWRRVEGAGGVAEVVLAEEQPFFEIGGGPELAKFLGQQAPSETAFRAPTAGIAMVKERKPRGAKAR